MTDLVDVFKWMRSHDSGASSEAIAMHMIAGWSDGSFPRDPADLGRCLRLLELFPEWKPRIGEMSKYGAVWQAYADQWEDMESSMRDEVGIDWSKGRSAEKTYGLMKRIEADGWRSDPEYDCTFNDEGHLRSAFRKSAA